MSSPPSSVLAVLDIAIRTHGARASWLHALARAQAAVAFACAHSVEAAALASDTIGALHQDADSTVSIGTTAGHLPFQIAIALLLALGAALIGRWYIHGLQRRAGQLERAVADRTADLSVAHESLAKAKQQVEQAHGQVLAVLNQLDIGVLVLNATGTVRYASASAHRILEKGNDALVGRPWPACLPLIETDRAQLKARIEAPSSMGARLPVQMVLGGKRYWVEIDVRDEPRPGTGRILYLYNVTEIATLAAGSRSDALHGLVGRSTAMQVVHKQIRDVARVDATVLIHGETGAGKELVARAIHRDSRRADRPFIAVNAAGLSESLLASQLFGHRRGAFTGAVADQVGVFEAANGGTVFLDEIGDIPSNMQVSVLRVLQEREITRIGDSHARRLDVRFLAATHRELRQEVAEGRFRQDLLYRIRVATIAVPPLRVRLDDVPLLADTFLAHAAHQSGRAVPEVSRDAMEALMRHSWPGNVRELKSAVEWALLNMSGSVIRPRDLPLDVLGREPMAALALPMDAEERERLVEALRRTGGNRTEAARLLGIGRTTLYRRLAAHGIDT